MGGGRQLQQGRSGGSSGSEAAVVSSEKEELFAWWKRPREVVGTGIPEKGRTAAVWSLQYCDSKV